MLSKYHHCRVTGGHRWENKPDDHENKTLKQRIINWPACNNRWNAPVCMSHGKKRTIKKDNEKKLYKSKQKCTSCRELQAQLEYTFGRENVQQAIAEAIIDEKYAGGRDDVSRSKDCRRCAGARRKLAPTPQRQRPYFACLSAASISS